VSQPIEKENMSTRLFVGNLPYGASEEEVRTALASPDITIKSVRLAVDRETGRGRGFGFVEVGSPEEAERALQEWTGRLIGGRPIAIDRAHERRPGSGPPSGPPPRRGPYPTSGAPRYATPPPPPEPEQAPRLDGDRDHHAADRDEEGRRRARTGPGGPKGRKKGTTGREAPKERGGKWRYNPSQDY
jgi:RNA recognition motif-containing protein